MNEQQTQQYMTQKTIFLTFGVPIAIVIAGVFIAGAVLISAHTGRAAPIGVVPTIKALNESDTSLENLRAVSVEDHIRGNPDAPIKIVEYSDFECPFCKRFHDTMNEVMDKYGDSGEVAWVFRQFPFEQLHPVKAQAVAVASECVAEQGGNDAFWKFNDGYFDVTLTNNRTDIETVIPQLVKQAGLDQAAFQACFESGKYDDHIVADIQNAIETGGRGTPWSVVVAPNGKTFPLNGAQSLTAVEQLIEIALNEQ